jgi:hypothetical protein
VTLASAVIIAVPKFADKEKPVKETLASAVIAGLHSKLIIDRLQIHQQLLQH